MEPSFSRQWRETFGRVDPERTELEVAFLARVLPLPEFASVLDVPCGTGRHMRLLAERGYRPVGVDNDGDVVREARAAGLDARLGDMRKLDTLPREFAAVVCLWASFGYFDAATNDGVLRQLARRLRRGGRLVLDVYHRAFFERHHGSRENRGVRETKTVRGGRLHAELEYPDGARDVFEWQLYAPEELAAAAERHGLDLLLACSGFDERLPPDAEEPRMQLVFSRAT